MTSNRNEIRDALSAGVDDGKVDDHRMKEPTPGCVVFNSNALVEMATRPVLEVDYDPKPEQSEQKMET